MLEPGVSIVLDAFSLRPKEKTLCRRAESTPPQCLSGELTCAKLGIQEISTMLATPLEPATLIRKVER